MVSDYRVSPVLAARLMGLGLVMLALLVFGTTLLVALARWPFVVVAVVGLLGLLVVAGGAAWLVRRAVVLHTDERGYRVHLVRGAGTREARWDEVEDAVTAVVTGTKCLVLRLRDGRTTTIPAEAIAGDREQLVRDIQERLRAAGGGAPSRRRTGS